MADYNVSESQKKVRNFCRKVIREVPILKQSWEEIMSTDEEKHDDYGSLELIHRIFKDYGTASSGHRDITFNSEKRKWDFFVPINIGRRGAGLSYEEAEDLAKKVEGMAKEFWPNAKEIKAWNGDGPLNSTEVIKVSIYEGGAKEDSAASLIKIAVKKFIKNRKLISKVKAPEGNTVYIFEDERKGYPLNGYSVFSFTVVKDDKRMDGRTAYNLYAQCDGRYSDRDYFDGDSSVDSKVIYDNMVDDFTPPKENRDYGYYD